MSLGSHQGRNAPLITGVASRSAEQAFGGWKPLAIAALTRLVISGFHSTAGQRLFNTLLIVSGCQKALPSIVRW